MGWERFSLTILALLALGGCTTTVHAPDSSISQVAQGPETVHTHYNGAAPTNTQTNFESDMAMEGEVSQGCVDAWRIGLKGDEKGAMAKLNELEKKYPNVLTIAFMKGQVLDHLGKKKEAVTFYRQAVNGKEFSTIHIFKLAEALRTTNQYKEAVEDYRRLVTSAPDFVPGKIGMAKSLLALDKNSQEARTQLESIIQLDENNAEAKALLQKMKAETK